MSPGPATRTLSWPGSLKGKPLVDLAAWILQWDHPYQATVAIAAINSWSTAGRSPVRQSSNPMD